MKKIFKKIISMTMIATLLGANLTAFATEKEKEATYVALGDSIPAGYALPEGTKGFVDIVGETQKMKVFNYAVSGSTSQDLINALNAGSYDEGLKEASIVTISIGSNDLLLYFVELVMGEKIFDVSMHQNISKMDKEKLMSLLGELAKLNTVLKDNKELYARCDNYKNNTFPKIISLVSEKAPNAQIYVTNIYNAFYEFVDYFAKASLDLSAIADEYIRKINETFSSDATTYKLVNVYDSFNVKGLTNVFLDLSQPTKISIDPHPNEVGHQKIAELINHEISINVKQTKDAEKSNSKDILKYVVVIAGVLVLGAASYSIIRKVGKKN